MNLNDIELEMLDGTKTTFGAYKDKTVLVVNVASKCGLTPQYEALEKLQETYPNFTVLGVPSDQFKQEFKDADDISNFCKLNYGVTFPLTKLSKVNGRNQHPLFKELKKTKDAAGVAGPVRWNFEKFLVLPNGDVHRFRPTTKPDDPKILELLKK
ncbi:MAG: glutathione peroxidase [Micrococcales bacterium]